MSDINVQNNIIRTTLISLNKKMVSPSTKKRFATIIGGAGKKWWNGCEKCLNYKHKNEYSGHNKLLTNYLVVLLLFMSSLETVSCEPISGSSSASSGSSGPGGTWSIRAIPHQSNTGYPSTLYEQVQNLKYNWETSTEHLLRKIETLESKISRLETSNQLRLEKLTESVNSKEIKDELAMEQLLRKLDANYERINHKIGFMETRLDATLNKIQTNMENGFSRIETRQNDIDTELNDINQSVEEIKILTAQIDEKHNTTQRSVQQHLQTITLETPSRNQIEKLTGTLQQIGVKLNDTNYPIINTQNQNDASGQSDADRERIIEMLKTEVDRESHRIENKISNMYNDLWRRFISLEATVKTGLTLSNTTRRIVQEDFKALLQQHEKQRNAEPDSQENYIEIVMDALMSTIQELARKVDSNFQMIITSQNLFMENCHRLQLEEPQLESKISLVLEKILNTVTNKTTRVDNRLVETMEMIKSHQSQVMRSMGHTTKMVVTLTEETNQDAKNMETALLELAERSAIVTMAIQELQDDIEMLANLTSLKLNNEIEEWFNKTMNENYDNEEINKTKTTEKEETSVEPTISTIPITTPSATQTSTTKNQDHDKEKKYTNYKNIKYADSDEVIKIFTEDDNFNENVNRNESENKGKEKKISIVIPNKYYNNFDNNENLTNKTKLYRILLHNLLNQTGELTDGDNIDAIILNTESDTGNNNNNKTNKKENNTTKLLSNNEFINRLNQSSFENNQTTKLETKNLLLATKNNNSSEEITPDIKNNATKVTDKTDGYNKTIDTEKKTNLTISTKIQNIREIMKSKFDNYKNQKYKNDLGKDNNKGFFQLLQYRFQNQNNSKNRNINKLIEKYNKKRKSRNQTKQSNILKTEKQNEDQKTENVQNKNDNKQLSKDTLQTDEINPEDEKQYENTSTDVKETEYPIGTETEDENDEMTSPIISDENINNEDNFYSETKYPYLDTDLSSLHSSDTREQFPDYDDSKTF